MGRPQDLTERRRPMSQSPPYLPHPGCVVSAGEPSFVAPHPNVLCTSQKYIGNLGGSGSLGNWPTNGSNCTTRFRSGFSCLN